MVGMDEVRHRRLDLTPMNGFEAAIERWQNYYVVAGEQRLYYSACSSLACLCT